MRTRITILFMFVLIIATAFVYTLSNQKPAASDTYVPKTPALYLMDNVSATQPSFFTVKAQVLSIEPPSIVLLGDAQTSLILKILDAQAVLEVGKTWHYTMPEKNAVGLKEKDVIYLTCHGFHGKYLDCDPGTIIK